MDRKKFIATCGMGCIGIIAGGMSLSSCRSVIYLQKYVASNQIRIGLAEFLIKGKSRKHRKYILVKPDALSHPMVVYRESEGKFRVLLLKCTHQGAKLNVHGDLISCPAHGSEFSNTGEVIKSPAFTPLKSFEYTVLQNELVIELS